MSDYTFPYETEGILQFDPGKGTENYEPFWCLGLFDDEISRYYRWFMAKEGTPTHKPNNLWRFHVSVIKHELPIRNADQWGKFEGKKIKIRYGGYVSYTNGKHAWLTVVSDDFNEVRGFYGLPKTPNPNCGLVTYHMTLGRLITEIKI
jgi:hypothetical protein